MNFTSNKYRLIFNRFFSIKLSYNQTKQLNRNKMNSNSYSTDLKLNELEMPIEKLMESNSSVLAGICHMRSINDKETNLEQVEKIVQMAKSKDIKFLFLPECCDFVGENREQTIKLAEPLDSGYIIENYKNLAKYYKMWLSFGGIHELILNNNGENTEKIFNTHIIIDDNGDIIAKYRKLHLFDVDTSDFKFRESKIVEKGPEIIEPIKTPIGNIGLQICYDLRFPEVSTILRKLGADILTYPSAFAYSTGKAHWDVLLRARAIENQCYVIAPAQIGFHNKKRQSYGNAMIVDPWGEVIAKCDNENGDIDLAYAEIDLNKLQIIRNNMPCFNHRRDEVYLLYPIQLSSYQNESKENRNFGKNLIQHETIFYETQYCYCFTNIRCVVPGHVLVATKRMVKRLIDLTPCEITDLFQTVVKIEKYLEKFYNATSSTVTVQDGIHAGQTVEHVHFHIMPRHEGDFEINDEIYLKLQSHDHNPENERRQLHEMIAEAHRYRDFMKNTKL